MSTLRSKIIRLAHEKPELRAYLLPLIKKEASLTHNQKKILSLLARNDRLPVSFFTGKTEDLDVLKSVGMIRWHLGVKGYEITQKGRDVLATPKSASRLKMGPGKVEQQVTSVLQKASKFPAKNKGDRTSAIWSAAHHARKQGKTMFVYQGNSYMHEVWRVSTQASDYLNPINNTGLVVYSVTPDLMVSRHEIER